MTSHEAATLAETWIKEHGRAQDFIKECDKFAKQGIHECAKLDGVKLSYEVPQDFVAKLEEYKTTHTILQEMETLWKANRKQKIIVADSKSSKEIETTLDKVATETMVYGTLDLVKRICGLADAILEHEEVENN